MTRIVPLLGALVFVLLLSSTPLSVVPLGPSTPTLVVGPVALGKVDIALQADLAAAAPEEPVEAVLRLALQADVEGVKFQYGRVVDRLKDVAEASQTTLRSWLEAKGLVVARGFWIVNAVLVRGTPSQILEATRPSLVTRVIPNFAVEVLGGPDAAAADAFSVEADGVSADVTYTWGLSKIRAPDVWSQVGVNGQGVRVCVSDTGVDISHPDLAGKMASDDPSDPTYPGGWIEFDGSGNPVVGSEPHDTQGHGTHTSGTALGGATSGVAIGVAPGATLMHALVLPGGGGTFAQVIAGIEWCVAPTDASGNPAGQPADVHSMSWGATGVYDDLVEPIRNSYFAGVIPVAAAGNCGDGCSGSPGNVYESFAIGASDANDDIASFSSGEVIQKTMWGAPPADWPDEWVVPDLAAPGVGVYSSLPGGGYDSWSGTSMATPHVAGCVALMKATNPNLTPDRALAAVTGTAVWYNTYAPAPPDTRYGAGRLDCLEAVLEVAFESGVEGYVLDAADLTPLDQGTVTADDGVDIRAAPTAADGFYRIYLRPGTYNLTGARFGYVDGVYGNVTVQNNTWTRQDILLDALPSGSIAGTATANVSGLAVPDVTVTVLDVPIVLRTSTDVTGGFVFPKLPVGTYALEATSPYFVRKLVADVQVLEGGQTAVSIVLDARPRVAVLGDSMTSATSGKLGAFLDGNDYLVEYAYWWDVIADPCRYQAVVVNAPGDPGATTFADFLAATDAAGTGVLFLDAWSISQSSGLYVLQSNLGDPAVRNSGYDPNSAETYYEVTTPHPILGSLQAGDRLVFDNTTFWHTYAWFDGYVGENGTTLADVGLTSFGVLGRGLAVDDRANNRHVLLSLHGVSFMTPSDWTADGAALMVRALDWAMRPTPCDDAIPVDWNLTVDPPVGLWSDTFNVSVNVANVGSGPGNYTATLYVDGGWAGQQTVPLASGEQTVVTFSVNRDPVGTYAVAVGPHTGSFRVRPPNVALAATDLDGLPLAGALVDAVLGSSVVSLGTLDANGTIAFPSPAGSHGNYALAVRAYAVNGVNYFLTQQVLVEADVAFAFAPQPTNTASLAVALDPVAAGHAGEIRLRSGSMSAGVETAFAFPPGTVVVFQDTYAAVFVMSLADPEAVWTYTAAVRTLDLTSVSDLTIAFGGPLEARVSSTQTGTAATVSWTVQDAYGNALAQVASESTGFLAAAETVQYPFLTLWNDSGALLVGGYVTWTQNPASVTVPDGETVAFEQLDLDTGPYPLRNVFDLGVALWSLNGTAVADGSAVTDLSVHVAGTVLRFGEAIPAQVDVNGMAAALDAAGAFNVTLPLQEGWNAIVVEAQDLAGNVRRAEVHVLAKTTVLLSLVPVPSLTNASPVTVAGSVETGAALTVNGDAVAVASDGSFATDVALAEGPNAIVVRAVDVYGNAEEVVLNVTLDTMPPALAVLSPTDGALTREDAVRVAGTVEAGVALLVAGMPVDTAGGTFQVDVPLAEGPNAIVVAATDAAGNGAEIVLRVIRDTTPPELTVTTPTDGAVTPNAAVDVEGFVETNATVTVNGENASVENGRFVVPVLLDEGPNVVVVAAEDLAGNVAEVVRLVTLDTIPPLVVVTAPVNGTWTADRSVDIVGRAEDGSVVTVNGLPVLLDGDAFAATVDLEEGVNVVVVRAADAAGNVREVQVEVVRKTQVTLVVAGIDVLPGGAGIVVRGQAEPNAAVSVNGVPVTVDADGAFQATIPLAGAETSVVVVAVDILGNRAEARFVVSVADAPLGVGAVEGAWVAVLVAVAALAAAVGVFLWSFRRRVPEDGDEKERPPQE
jgi:subtilisin family serine protease